MEIPTADEIKAAYDGITRDGKEAQWTQALVMLVMMDDLMLETVERHIALLDVFLEDRGAFRSTELNTKYAIITASIVKGLNLGLRIGEARNGGMKSRPVTAA